MIDIYVAIAVIVVLSAILFSVPLLIKSKKTRYYWIIAGSSLVLLGLDITFSPHNWVANIIPFSNAIIFSNPKLMLCGLLAGAAWRLLKGKTYKKLCYVIPLMLFAIYSSYGFLLLQKPPSGNRWKSNVCIQTSESSCSAATAATLLRHYGIPATEREMIDLCLTRNNGTLLLGTYRGLKLKTEGTGYRVKLEKWSLNHLLNTKFPVIIQAKLNRWGNADPRYAKNWGWTPGVSHAVIFWGKDAGDRVVMVDPSVGREKWRQEGIKTLWHGRVIYIEKKN
jgi:predicted double-glycine peptidase